MFVVPEWRDPIEWAEEEGCFYQCFDGRTISNSSPGISHIIMNDYFRWEKKGQCQKAIWCLIAAVALGRWE